MSDLRIADAPELTTENIEVGLKIPTGGFGNYSVTTGTIADWLVGYKDLATNSNIDNQFSDLKTRGLALPYDSKITYQENAIVVKDGELQQLKNGVFTPVLNSSTKTVNTISELTQIKNPKDTQVVYVLGYNEGSRKGGGNFYYDDGQKGVYNGITIFDGWVRILGDHISPTFAGAKADGKNDERFFCELSIYYANVYGLDWLVENDEVYLLNSYSNISELPNYSARILPLLSNVKYNIKGRLKVGSFFDDRDFFVFTDINSAEINTRQHQYDYTLTGGGIIDFSLAGTRKTTYKNRQGVYTQNSSRVTIENLTFRDGDLPNCITTALSGEDFTIKDCRFINLMGSNLSNDDHSTIYGTAKKTKISNCHFEMNTINGFLNACAVELHNSNSYFKDSTIERYRASHIIAAITVENPYIENIEVCGLNAEVYRNFSILDVWTGSTLYNAKIHDNSSITLNFPIRSELIEAGFNPDIVYAGSAMCLVTNDSAVGYSLEQGSCYEVEYYNNTYVNTRADEVNPKFKSMIYMVKSMSMGISFKSNNVVCKNIFRVHEDVSQDHSKYNFSGFSILESNSFKELGDNPFYMQANTINSSVFNFTVNNPTSGASSFMVLDVTDVAASNNNTFSISGSYANTIPLNIVDRTGVLENTTTRFRYIKTHGVYVEANLSGQTNFFLSNTKNAKVVDRLNLPEEVSVSDYLGGLPDGKLIGTSYNSSGEFGIYDVRLTVSNF